MVRLHGTRQFSRTALTLHSQNVCRSWLLIMNKSKRAFEDAEEPSSKEVMRKKVKKEEETAQVWKRNHTPRRKKQIESMNWTDNDENRLRTDE